MLRIKRLDHVSMAVWKLDEALPLFTELFGMRVVDRSQSEEEGYQGVTLDIDGGGTQWELMEPTSGDGFVARFLRERGPGLHHVTLEVEDMAEAVEALRERGIEPFGGIREGPTWKETFIHPRDTGGVLVQLYEGEWS